MNVTCPNCATTYRVDPAKVPEAGVRARCAVCSAVFAVSREAQPVAAAAPAPAALQPAPAPRDVAPPPPQPPAPAPAPVPTPPAPRPEPPRVEAPPAPAPRMPPPPQVQRPVAVPPPAQPAAAATPRPAPPAKPVQAPTLPTPAPAAAPAAARPPAPAGARPVNPFLSQDPSLKAKRLARALISDMVVYHPAKRQEGLRDGNLKELFDEEIKKSWEEYSDQVGRELAESTGYFREALNEILAGGRQIF